MTQPLKTMGQCIADGIEFLDYKRPEWWKKPKRKTFEMGNGCFSLLAQIEGVNYREALIAMGLTDGKTRDANGRPVYPDMVGIPYGFMQHQSDPPVPGIERFTADQLQEAWILVIRERREKK